MSPRDKSEFNQPWTRVVVRGISGEAFVNGQPVTEQVVADIDKARDNVGTTLNVVRGHAESSAVIESGKAVVARTIIITERQ